VSTGEKSIQITGPFFNLRQRRMKEKNEKRNEEMKKRRKVRKRMKEKEGERRSR